MVQLSETIKPNASAAPVSPAVDALVQKYGDRVKDILRFIQGEKNPFLFYASRVGALLEPTNLEKYSQMIWFRKIVKAFEKDKKSN